MKKWNRNMCSVLIIEILKVFGIVVEPELSLRLAVFSGCAQILISSIVRFSARKPWIRFELQKHVHDPHCLAR